MHDDFFVLGKANNTAVNIRNFELLKWSGANSIRTSHYPYSEEVMSLADEYGIMVIDEVPAVGMNWWKVNFSDDTINGETQALHKELVRQLVARDKNHPCVIMLSVANEAGTHEDASRDYFKGVIDCAREISDLPVTIVEFTKFDDGCKVGDLVDVICLNRYYGWYSDHGDLSVVYSDTKSEMEKYYNGFGKPIIMTEFGADTIEGLHALPSESFSEEFQKEYIEECCKAFDECEYCIGEHVWNFADFKTKQGLTRIRGNRKGVFTKDRQPKMSAHFLRERWTKM
jgi:beta-glucuronidase